MREALGTVVSGVGCEQLVLCENAGPSGSILSSAAEPLIVFQIS